MKIAIHHKPNDFSKRWVNYCKCQNITYKIVNCYDNNIIEQVKDYDVLLWHFSHNSLKDSIAAKPILFALEQSGVSVFPNFNTSWHFDDKVAQKYLLESINAPLIPSFVFYEKDTANDWVDKAIFPKVFKLKGGAGSQNVKLVKTKNEARNLIKKAFKKGFKRFNRWDHLNENLRKYNKGLINFNTFLRALARAIVGQRNTSNTNKDKGYIYFQEFIPNNDSDTRIIVVGDRAFGIKRMTRDGDFRASGSGNIVYDKNELDINCVSIAFEVARKLKAQNIAFDFVFDQNNNPLIVEISYGHAVALYDKCPGYWDSCLNWHERTFVPQEWIIQDLITSLKVTKKQ